MAKQAIQTNEAPNARPGLLSQAIVAGNFVFCSGSVGMDPKIMRIVDGDVQAHTHQCIKNLAAVLAAAGSSIDDVVKVNVYLSDLNDFAKMNEVYQLYWCNVKPARTCVAVKTLPHDTDVEIECTAMLTSPEKPS